MAAKPGAPYRSSNAGELSREAAGRVDLKQFYSAGLQFKNVEPVPLSGFRRMAGSYDEGPVRGNVAVLAKSGEVATPGPHTGTQVIWTANVAGSVVGVDLAGLVATTGAHTVYAEVFAAGVWQAFGSIVAVGTAARDITIGVAPGAAVAATAVRLKGVFSVSAQIAMTAVTVLTELAAQTPPRYAALLHDSGARYNFSLGAMLIDVFEDGQFLACAYLAGVGAAIAAQVNFYAEGSTLGIFHNDLETPRLKRGASGVEWVRDLWPYDDIPKIDLGGVYTKIDDKWQIQIKYTGGPFVYLSLIVDGETTPGVPFVDAANAPVVINGAVDDALTAARIKTALEALPSLGPTVTVVSSSLPGTTRQIDITFGGLLSGSEYGLVSTITNTADAAALASHIQIGKTNFEPILSAARGWAGRTGLVKDRLVYGDIKSVPPALAFSQAGEYFKLNIEAAGAAAAILDKLRGGQALERVLAVEEAVYPVILTDRGVYFISNRALSALEPRNYVKVTALGTVVTCDPAAIDQKLYYVGVDAEPPAGGTPNKGHQVLSLSYSEIDTNFEAIPEHIFATHLIEGIVRSKGQLAQSRADAAKFWLLRDDGRLIAANIITSQEVLGYCEWVAAAAAKIVEFTVDVANRVRMAVERLGRLRHERQDRLALFQATVLRSTDLAGGIAGLELFEGLDVWAKAQGYVLGPFKVASGTIALGDPYQGEVEVGVWQAPVWESMPRYRVLSNDEIVKRPGRIHTAVAEVLETTSIAMGANGQAIENVPLSQTADPADLPMPAKSIMVTRSGMLGAMTGTTLVVSQTRPGELHVRDLTIEEKL